MDVRPLGVEKAEKSGRAPPVKPIARRHRKGAVGDGGERPLRCVRCRRIITSETDRIDIDGLHEYAQINPHGTIWTFGCFARAPGCLPVGAPSSEFTWFAGHTWQIENCRRCELHLGWLFSSPDRQFHGLIVGRVVHEDEPDERSG